MWAAAIFKELLVKPFFGAGFILGVMALFLALQAGFVTTPQVTELMVKVAQLEAKIERLEVECSLTAFE
ncbi:MAG: hypothetical protein AAFX52_11060 [Pseudomonadota bacterium]